MSEETEVCPRCGGTGEVPERQWRQELLGRMWDGTWHSISEVSRLMGWPRTTCVRRLEHLVVMGDLRVEGSARVRRWMRSDSPHGLSAEPAMRSERRAGSSGESKPEAGDGEEQVEGFDDGWKP